jgi:hypothetical protein
MDLNSLGMEWGYLYIRILIKGFSVIKSAYIARTVPVGISTIKGLNIIQ